MSASLIASSLSTSSIIDQNPCVEPPSQQHSFQTSFAKA